MTKLKLIQMNTYRYVKSQLEQLKSQKLQELLLNGANDQLQGYFTALKDVLNVIEKNEKEVLENDDEDLKEEN